MNPGTIRRADASAVARMEATPAYLPEPQSIADVESTMAGQASAEEALPERDLPLDRPLTPADRILLCGTWAPARWRTLVSHAVANGVDVWLLDVSEPAQTLAALALIDAVGITLCDWWPQPTDDSGILCIDASGESRLPEHIGWLVGAAAHHQGLAESNEHPGLSLGYIDKQGWIHILGESRNTLRKDEWVLPPFEGARWLETHPRVTAAAMLAIDSETAALCGLVTGFFAVAEITGEGNPVLEVELLNYCRRGLSAVKCPQGILFVASLPRTSSGRPDLARLWAALADEVGCELVL